MTLDDIKNGSCTLYDPCCQIKPVLTESKMVMIAFIGPVQHLKSPSFPQCRANPACCKPCEKLPSKVMAQAAISAVAHINAVKAHFEMGWDQQRQELQH